MSQVSPYDDNGGSCIAIAGEDYAVLASDTRQSKGYSIQSRYMPKAHEITQKAVLGCCGFQGDSTELVMRLKQDVYLFQYNHRKPCPTPSIAQRLSMMLYQKRFFPYYVKNILAGIDAEGKGCIYSYDPVGSFERYQCAASGSAESLLQPFLDSQVMFKNTNLESNPPLLPLDRAVQLAKDIFTSATERDIYTGDHLEIFIIRSTGVEKLDYPLKRD